MVEKYKASEFKTLPVINTRWIKYPHRKSKSGLLVHIIYQYQFQIDYRFEYVMVDGLCQPE